MDERDHFYTMKGYMLQSGNGVTSAMEDYLEMIARLAGQKKSVRVGDLSKMLHVKASSATKMVQHLDQAGLIQAKKYGEITLTESGRVMGDYLLYRHEVIHRFLCTVNRSENELEQVEKIEHFLDGRTVKNLERITALLQDLG